MDETPSHPPKSFTASEANALLSKARPLIEQLQGLQHSILKTNHQLDEMVNKLAGGNGYPIQAIKDKVKELTKRQLTLIEAFQAALKQLEDLGCLVKDVSLGLLDFYSSRNGEPILLCWKLGEEQVRFWHTLESGYASRQPVDA